MAAASAGMLQHDLRLTETTHLSELAPHRMDAILQLPMNKTDVGLRTGNIRRSLSLPPHRCVQQQVFPNFHALPASCHDLSRLPHLMPQFTTNRTRPTVEAKNSCMFGSRDWIAWFHGWKVSGGQRETPCPALEKMCSFNCTCCRWSRNGNSKEN